MNKEYTSLGLMSGTSGDSVDASIICSDETKYKVILDKFFQYEDDIYKSIHNLKGKIFNLKDLAILPEKNYRFREILLYFVKL